jgi:hypothetical protein
MNKTRRRAMQKHRAKETKFEVRRKSSGDPSEAKGKPGLTVNRSATRSRSSARRTPGNEAAE